MVNLGIDDVYYIPRMQKLDLHPALIGGATNGMSTTYV